MQQTWLKKFKKRLRIFFLKPCVIFVHVSVDWPFKPLGEVSYFLLFCLFILISFRFVDVNDGVDGVETNHLSEAHLIALNMKLIISGQNVTVPAQDYCLWDHSLLLKILSRDPKKSSNGNSGLKSNFCLNNRGIRYHAC